MDDIAANSKAPTSSPEEPTPTPTPTSAPTPASAPVRASGRFSTWRALQTVISVAILMATLFTLWTPANLFSSNINQKMSLALMANVTPQPASGTQTAQPVQRIGIIAGHSGKDSNGKEIDPGAVCKDGLTEADVNMRIATLVKQSLTGDGFTVDLLNEFDPRLQGYQASVVLSIHNDSCDYINDEASGFKVAASQNSNQPQGAERLSACLIDRYASTTGLRFHYNSITPDMTNYHAFNEIDPNTVGAIIETGFLNLDRQILTEHTDVVARGVTAGILCYIHNEMVSPTPTPTQP